MTASLPFSVLNVSNFVGLMVHRQPTVLSESVDTKLPNLKHKFLTAFKNGKHYDFLVSIVIVGGGSLR